MIQKFKAATLTKKIGYVLGSIACLYLVSPFVLAVATEIPYRIWYAYMVLTH